MKQRVFKTRGALGSVDHWAEVHMEQWDRAGEHSREILFIPGEGCVFVVRAPRLTPSMLEEEEDKTP